MTIHSETKLEEADYEVPGWVHIYNSNVDRLNSLLLKIEGLLDVDLQGLKDGALLVWNGNKWIVRNY